MNKDKILENYITTFWVENNNDKPIKLYVEPWGSDFEIPPKKYIRIVARGPKLGCPSFWNSGLDFIYSAWAGSVFAVYKDGKLISDWDLDTCPPEPSPIRVNEYAFDNFKILEGLTDKE